MINFLTILITKLYRYWYVTLSVLIITSILIFYTIYKYTIRITSIRQLPTNYKNMKLKGIVTSISDGDGFRFFHTPFLRSKVYKKGDQTLQIRLAGIDAPEVRKFSRPAQPFSKESKEYLMNLLLNKCAVVKILGIDQYNRIIGTVFVYKGINKVNVNVEMVKVGLACVYYGKGALYDDYMEKLEMYEKKARNTKIGMWNQKNYVSPMDYKKYVKT